MSFKKIDPFLATHPNCLKTAIGPSKCIPELENRDFFFFFCRENGVLFTSYYSFVQGRKTPLSIIEIGKSLLYRDSKRGFLFFFKFQRPVIE